MEGRFLVLMALVGAAWSMECPPCSEMKCPEECDSPGLVPDPCECCPLGVCGLPLGSRCYNATLLPFSHAGFGACGPDMYCLPREDLSSMDEPEALCVCKNLHAVCGTDNSTYDTICQLKQHAGNTGFPRFKHWGACPSVPKILSGPENKVTSLGLSVGLGCEVKGHPIPNIYWEFTSKEGKVKRLPDDDLYVAVQVRGGPEPYMATSWVQLVDVRQTDLGTYTCIAKNPEGITRASAIVTAR